MTTHFVDCFRISQSGMVHISPAVRRYIERAKRVAGTTLNGSLLIVNRFYSTFKALHAEASCVELVRQCWVEMQSMVSKAAEEDTKSMSVKVT